MSPRILIADDEPLYLRTTGELLRSHGYECVCVEDADSAISKLKQEKFDLVLSDLNMPGNLKLELLTEHSRRPDHSPLIVITGVPSLPSAIESIRLGITDYLLKPVKFETLLESVERALRNAPSTRAAASNPTPPRSELQAKFPTIVANSPAMMEVLEIIDRIAATNSNILITGESGTGKEVVAKAIHQHSPRVSGTFQVIDCTAIPDTLFESMLFGHKKGSFTGAVTDQSGLLAQCDGGTAFFDELGELPLPMQAKLLRVVQEQTFTPVGTHTSVRVNTRFVCATNRDLQAEVAHGRFRQDLYYRLGVIHIRLPPLRERGDDCIQLAEHFLHLFTRDRSSQLAFSAKAIELLRAYSWPGNIRELRNAVERSVALCRGQQIEPSDLPESVQGVQNHSQGNFATVTSRSLSSGSVPSREEALKAAEHQYLLDLMRNHGGNVSKAARQADISRQGLHKLLRNYGITPGDYRN
ncbi:sigma-54-dependent transcriptional regulator [Pirellulaceae bacterium SH449]